MNTLNDIHLQFASFFKSRSLQPYAYLVSKRLSEGHICVDLKTIDEERDELPPAYKDEIFLPEELASEKQVSIIGAQKQPFILHNRKLYLQRYFNYETLILNRVRDLISSEESMLQDRTEKLRAQTGLIIGFFKQNEKLSGPVQTNWQLAATLTSALSNFSIITGGPGTGKTTTVAKILTLLFDQEPNLKVALAAPTGKAAARMAESLKAAGSVLDSNFTAKFASIEPSTLHRLLGFIRDSPYFRHNSTNPLPYDLLIIDESSMIDAALLAKLLDAVSIGSRVILLGDKDQLASVEAGSLFGDLCDAQDELNLFDEERANIINSFAQDAGRQLFDFAISPNSGHVLFQHVVELKQSHRFSSDEGIGKLSTAVIKSDKATISNFYDQASDNRIVLDTDYSRAIFEDFVNTYHSYIQEVDTSTALKKLNMQRVLCAIREGEHGLYALNRKIEAFLAEKKWISTRTEFYEHRPIMVTANNYSLGLFNGDIGIIRRDDEGVLKAWFEDASGGLKSILPGLISSAETVYAMTIHKSQGSEFNEVMIVLPEGENKLMTRELLYTGITRAKNKVIISGSQKNVLLAASSRVKRASGISERFRLEGEWR